MHARLSFTTDSGPQDEAAARAALAELRPPTTTPYLYGAVELDEPGKAALRFEDDLEYLVYNLCIQAPRDLAANGHADVWMASWPQTYTLRRDGADVVFTDDEGTEVGRFAEEELLPALEDCAWRFVDFMGELSRVRPEWGKLHARLLRDMATDPNPAAA